MVRYWHDGNRIQGREIYDHFSFKLQEWRNLMSPKNKDAHLPTVDEVDKVIHESARLIIMANLSLVESADFLFVMKQTGLTFGNLSSHMKKLEEAGYIEILKEFVDRRPRTTLKLTQTGRKAFMTYRNSMRLLFDQTDS